MLLFLRFQSHTLNSHSSKIDVKNANAAQRENDSTWHASNGFLQRSAPDTLVMPKDQPAPANLSRQQYKHLISDRGFEDILQACRPRNRGEYGSGLPTSLTTLLKKAVPGNKIEVKETKDRHRQKAGVDHQRSEQLVPLTPHKHASRSRLPEWGAVNFDDFTRERLNNSQQTPKLNRSFSGGSGCSPSSSFASIGSFRFPSHLISHLQSTASLDGGGHSESSGGENSPPPKRYSSDGSMATLDEDMQQGSEASPREKSQSLSDIQKLMAEHDKNTFSRLPKTSSRINGALQSPGSARSSLKESSWPGSPARGVSQSALLPVLKKGGIEAALVKYDTTRQKKEQGSIPTAGHLLENFIVNSEEAVGRSSLATSPLSIGMPFSLDRRSDGLRPSVMRLVAPEAIPRASRQTTDGFQLLDQRKKSFQFQPLDQRRNSLQLLSHRRKSQWDKPKENGVKNDNLSATSTPFSPRISLEPIPPLESGDISRPHHHTPQHVKSKKQHSRRSHHRHSNRHRRKQWVLNPFRREDEDEVLAKRTHNRRYVELMCGCFVLMCCTLTPQSLLLSCPLFPKTMVACIPIGRR